MKGGGGEYRVLASQLLATERKDSQPPNSAVRSGIIASSFGTEQEKEKTTGRRMSGFIFSPEATAELYFPDRPLGLGCSAGKLINPTGANQTLTRGRTTILG